MGDAKYEIKEHIGTISKKKDRNKELSTWEEWNKELNLVSWNGYPPKYDIREWSGDDHNKMRRGITLSEEEAAKLCRLLCSHLHNDSDFRYCDFADSARRETVAEGRITLRGASQDECITTLCEQFGVSREDAEKIFDLLPKTEKGNNNISNMPMGSVGCIVNYKNKTFDIDIEKGAIETILFAIGWIPVVGNVVGASKYLYDLIKTVNELEPIEAELYKYNKSCSDTRKKIRLEDFDVHFKKPNASYTMEEIKHAVDSMVDKGYFRIKTDGIIYII